MPSATIARTPIAAFSTVLCTVTLASVVASAQTSQKTTSASFRDARGQQATLTRTSGYVINGGILSLNEREVQINAGGRVRRVLTIPAKDVRTLVTQEDTFTYNQDKKLLQSARDLESTRSGKVKFVNKTGKQVTVIVTGFHDKQGKELRFEEDRSKSNLETALEAFSGTTTSAKPKVLDLEANETAFLKLDGKQLVTSKIWYNLRTTDGHRSGVAAKDEDDPAADFLIPIGERDIHSPVLVKAGKWNLEQDIWYTTARARTPGRIVPVKGLFSGKIEHYEVYGGEDYEYSQENRSGYATAWAEIENPTDKTLEVVATVEFHFTHLLLSHERVNATITIAPKAKTKIFITVNTLAIVGNRKATSVSLVDLTTTPK